LELLQWCADEIWLWSKEIWRVLAYAWDLCEIRCLCEISLSRGYPWWLYICSQLGFTSSCCLLLQVEVLALAGFMYPLSGLLPWQKSGRLISRTRGVIPSSSGFVQIFSAIRQNFLTINLVKKSEIVYETKGKPWGYPSK
jgi:hypothetical protein